VTNIELLPGITVMRLGGKVFIVYDPAKVTERSRQVWMELTKQDWWKGDADAKRTGRGLRPEGTDAGPGATDDS
jgi:hypothetical protein